MGASSLGLGLSTQSTEVHRKTNRLSLVPRGAQVHMAVPGLSGMGRGAGLPLLHPLPLPAPPPRQVCAVAVGAGLVPGPVVTFRALTVPSAPAAQDGGYGIQRLGQGGGAPTFNLVDI